MDSVEGADSPGSHCPAALHLLKPSTTVGQVCRGHVVSEERVSKLRSAHLGSAGDGLRGAGSGLGIGGGESGVATWSRGVSQDVEGQTETR